MDGVQLAAGPREHSGGRDGARKNAAGALSLRNWSIGLRFVFHDY